jgi:hypothetical protein
MINMQRVSTLEKKCQNITTDEANLRERETSLRKEIDHLKEDRMIIHREGTE